VPRVRHRRHATRIGFCCVCLHAIRHRGAPPPMPPRLPPRRAVAFCSRCRNGARVAAAVAAARRYDAPRQRAAAKRTPTADACVSVRKRVRRHTAEDVSKHSTEMARRLLRFYARFRNALREQAAACLRVVPRSPLSFHARAPSDALSMPLIWMLFSPPERRGAMRADARPAARQTPACSESAHVRKERRYYGEQKTGQGQEVHGVRASCCA